MPLIRPLPRRFTGTPPVTTVFTDWRVVWTSSFANSTAACANMEMRSSEGGSDLTGGAGSVISSGWSAGFADTNAFNGNTANFWAHSCADHSGKLPWVGWQFDSPVEIVEIVITARNDGSSGQAPGSGLVQSRSGSDDWVTQWNIPLQTAWTAGQTRTFNKSGDTTPTTTILDAHRYWLLRPFAAYSTNLVVGEWELYETVGGANVATGQSYWANIEQSGFPVTKMFDGSTTGGWAISSNWAALATVDFGVGDERVLEQAGIRGSSTGAIYALRTGSVYFSDNGSTWRFAGALTNFPSTTSTLTKALLTGEYTLT